MAETVHVVLTDYGPGFGWGITSPQLPELIGGRDTREELERDLAELVSFGGAPDEAEIVVHWQRYRATEGREFVIRVARDGRNDERMRLAQRLTVALNVPGQLGPLLDAPTAAMGEVIFVCALADDLVGWVIDQIDPQDSAVVVASVDDKHIGATSVGRLGAETPDTVTLAEQGLSRESTVAELFDATPMNYSTAGEIRAHDRVLIPG